MIVALLVVTHRGGAHPGHYLYISVDLHCLCLQSILEPGYSFEFPGPCQFWRLFTFCYIRNCTDTSIRRLPIRSEWYFSRMYIRSINFNAITKRNCLAVDFRMLSTNWNCRNNWYRTLSIDWRFEVSVQLMSGVFNHSPT